MNTRTHRTIASRPRRRHWAPPSCRGHTTAAMRLRRQHRIRTPICRPIAPSRRSSIRCRRSTRTNRNTTWCTSHSTTCTRGARPCRRYTISIYRFRPIWRVETWSRSPYRVRTPRSRRSATLSRSLSAARRPCPSPPSHVNRTILPFIRDLSRPISSTTNKITSNRCAIWRRATP